MISQLKEALTNTAWKLAPGLAVEYYLKKELRRGDLPLLATKANLKPGDIAVDVGAYRGIYTRLMSGMVGVQGHVHAIEPNPQNFRHLNAAVGYLPNVTVFDLALSDHKGTVKMHIPLRGSREVAAMASLSAASIAGQTCRDVLVRTERLDDVVVGRRVDLIKIDVEGHEHEVLIGAERTIRNYHPTLVLEAEKRHGVNLGELFRYLECLGYEVSALFPDGPRPRSEFNVQRDQDSFIREGIQQTMMPRGYVNNFFCQW